MLRALEWKLEKYRVVSIKSLSVLVRVRYQNVTSKRFNFFFIAKCIVRQFTFQYTTTEKQRNHVGYFTLPYRLHRVFQWRKHETRSNSTQIEQRKFADVFALVQSLLIRWIAGESHWHLSHYFCLVTLCQDFVYFKSSSLYKCFLTRLKQWSK